MLPSINEHLLCVRAPIYKSWQFTSETQIALVTCCVKKRLLYGCPQRKSSSGLRCQRQQEYGRNWLWVNGSGFPIAQILCQGSILEVLTFHCKITLVISYRNCICLFFIVLSKRWLVRVGQN